MRAEFVPVIFGVVVALVGLALLADARLPEGVTVLRERRRRARAERSRGGEAAVGAGTICMAAALIGRDAWRFGTVAVLLGAVLIIAGAVMNRHYLRELIFFRGPARRAEESDEPTDEEATGGARGLPPASSPGRPATATAASAAASPSRPAASRTPPSTPAVSPPSQPSPSPGGRAGP